MTAVCLYFKVHQPYRLCRYSQGNIGVDHCYNNSQLDEQNIIHLSETCYLPSNEIIYRLIEKYKNSFHISFSISGTLLDLLEEYRPDVIASFKKLTDTGNVEILAETYYHSLCALHSFNEYKRQVKLHADKIQRLFGLKTAVLRNTELLYSNELANKAYSMGFKLMLCEGVERILNGRSPNQMFISKEPGNVNLLLRNARLSDDIAFRFNDHNWSEYPLTPGKFAEWLHSHPAYTPVINLFMDYETFGGYKPAESGIFEFLQDFPGAVLQHNEFRFSTPSLLLNEQEPVEVYDVHQTISWEDNAEAACAWSTNVKQHNTLRKIYHLEKLVMDSGSPKIIEKWGKLQSADHFYYMSMDHDGSNRYRNHFESIEEAYQHYNNILADFEILLIRKGLEKSRKKLALRQPALSFF